MLTPHTDPLPRARAPKHRAHRAAAPVALTAVALVALAAASRLDPVAAAPQGAAVTSGEATISSSGGQTVIDTTSQRTIIDYSSFNLGSNESVTFNQPNADAAVLNRVSGSGESFINGALLSNGQVYIVNPAGVTFGRNAVVNVGRLVAAASVVNSDDFLAGVDRFRNAGTDNVQNYSDAISGDNGVVFVGRVVDNQGTVRANGGTVAMVVGRDVLLSEGPDGQIFARIEGYNDPETRGPVFTRVTNNGLIDNPTGQVLIGAGDIFAISALRQGQINTGGLTLETGSAPLFLSEPSSRFSTVSDNASITINSARLEYYCDVAPNQRIALNAQGGFVNLTPGGNPDCGPAFVNGQPFPLDPTTPVTPVDPVTPVTPVDPNPLGLTSTFVDRYATRLPIDPIALGGYDRITPDPGQRRAMADRFGLQTTGFEDRPLADSLAAANVLNDLSANPGDGTISSERLSYGATQDALNAYDRVFPTATGGAAGRDADGNSLAGGPGGPSASAGEDVLPTEVDQTQRVRSMLQEAADRYMADEEVTEIDPEAFAAWLAENDPETLDALSGLDDLVNSTMPDLGLGASELDSFKQWTYGKIAPRGVSLRTLDELVAASARPI